MKQKKIQLKISTYKKIHFVGLNMFISTKLRKEWHIAKQKLREFFCNHWRIFRLHRAPPQWRRPRWPPRPDRGRPRPLRPAGSGGVLPWYGLTLSRDTHCWLVPILTSTVLGFTSSISYGPWEPGWSQWFSTYSWSKLPGAQLPDTAAPSPLPSPPPPSCDKGNRY
jgi:hypothetical protein